MNPETFPIIPSVPEGTTMTQLENGLVIIVREDHSAPVVSAQAWCMTGSVHEGSWLGAGLSHVLEHMLFKGTATRSGSRIDQEVQEAGGHMNAYTSFDRTVYHIDVPSTGARVALDILCDVMQYASLPPEELEKEKQVILREMDMNTDDPGRRASRRLFETVYTRSPYRFTIIGYPDIFNELRPEDIRTYYQQKYCPNNVFFVVVGDVQSSAVIEQIQSGWSKSKARPLPSEVLQTEPPQTALREVIEEAPIELGYVHFAWHIPGVRHPDIAALDVLGFLLGNGRSSRLYQQVRERQALVHSVDAWTYCPGEPGLFGMSATLEPENLEPARKAMLAEIERMKTTQVSREELLKAVKQFTAGTLSARKTMQGQANDLGSNWIAANDLNFSERFLAAIRVVTPEDVQRVARQYLTLENQSVYALLPVGAAPKPSRVSQTFRDHSIQKLSLSNGLRLLLKQDRRLPFVDFRAVFKGGVLAEDLANNGITQLMGRMLLKGTSSRTAEEIALQIESVGGSIDSYGGNNSFGVSAEVLAGDFATGLDLLRDVILNPAFPVAALEREREIQLASIRSHKDNLLHSATKMMRRGLFGERGYGLDTSGHEQSIGKLSTTDLAAFHGRLASPDNCVLAIFGDIDPEEARQAAERAFAGWMPSGAAGVPGPLSTPCKEARRLLEHRDKKQAVLVIGWPGTVLQDQDRYPLEILQETCSDLGSRLFLRIREELGLAYYVGAQNFLGLSEGYFSFYAGTAPESAGQVETELLREAALLRDEGLTAEELNRAKAKIIGARKIARQDLGSLAMATALDELYGLGYNYSDSEDERYEAVTLEATRAIARKYLTADGFVTALVVPGQT
jgi:zinc protease